MNYWLYSYTSGTDTTTKVSPDNGQTFLSPDPSSADWNTYLSWVSAGNTPTVIVAQQGVPDSISNYQARAILIQTGQFGQVDSAVRASLNPQGISAWDYANFFYRNSPFIGMMQAVLKLTDAQVDALFIQASLIK